MQNGCQAGTWMSWLRVALDVCVTAEVTKGPAVFHPNSYVGSVHLVCSRSAVLVVLETL